MKTLLLTAALVAAFILSARADDDSYRHARGHGHYKEWASGLTSNCCDERDCRDYADDEVRVTPTGDKELNIGDGQWCPVTPLHYVVRGKSPDATSYHACVIPNYNADPCERFKCFMDKWGG